MLARVNTARGPRKQAIAIRLSKARRAGVKLPPPKTGSKAPRDLGRGRTGKHKTSAKRSPRLLRALKREGRSAASKRALSRQAKTAAHKRSAVSRSRTARKATRTRRGAMGGGGAADIHSVFAPRFNDGKIRQERPIDLALDQSAWHQLFGLIATNPVSPRRSVTNNSAGPDPVLDSAFRKSSAERTT
jgi:Family of unknown function (DUF6496)